MYRVFKRAEKPNKGGLRIQQEILVSIPACDVS